MKKHRPKRKKRGYSLKTLMKDAGYLHKKTKSDVEFMLPTGKHINQIELKNGVNL